MPITAEVTPLEEDRVRLDVAVSEDEVRQRVDRTIRQIGRDIRVPGFRPGKVPPNVVLQRVGREMVVQEMLKEAIGDWYQAALSEHGLQPIDDPDVDVTAVPEDGDLTFQATVRLRPKPVLGPYRGLEVVRGEPEVPEGAVDREIDRLRETVATLVAVDRPAQAGDFLIIDFDGRVGSKTLRNASARDYLVELGVGRLVADFDEQLPGMSAGETKTFAVAYGPADQRAELRGKTLDYTVTLKAVQEKVLPEPSDDLAREVSELDTLDALRADIYDRLLKLAQAEQDELFRRRAIDAATAEATLEVPQVMIQRRVAAILHQTQHDLPQGVTLDDWFQASGRSPEQVITELAPEAELAIRRELVVEAIAESEGIHVTDEEVEAQVRSDAEAGGRDPDELLGQVRSQNAFETLRHDLELRRAVEIITETAVPITAEQADVRGKLWTPPTQEAAADAPKLWTPGPPRPTEEPAE